MRTHLFIVDPQNDFCDIPAAGLPYDAAGVQTANSTLAVTGADADMKRLAAFIDEQGDRIDDITVTLDSHPSVAIERTTFWVDAAGDVVKPFTIITADLVRQGSFVPRDRSLMAQVLDVLDKLAVAGADGLPIWPVHCVTGTWGANIHAALAGALDRWELKRQRAVVKVFKGEHPLTDHLGAFEANVPRGDAPATHFNQSLVRRITACDQLLIAGEASSHCVAISVDQLLARLTSAVIRRPQIMLLLDCMSPVAGFDHLAKACFKRAAARGVFLGDTGVAAAAMEASGSVGERVGAL